MRSNLRGKNENEITKLFTSKLPSIFSLTLISVNEYKIAVEIALI